MSQKRSGNITELKRGFKIDLGTIIFIVIMIYIIICLVLSLKNESITGYQVKTGMLSENRIYNGIALRDEHVVYTGSTGYVNYFVTEGEKAKAKSLVYCIDESGKVSDLYGSLLNLDNSLTTAELSSLRQDIQLFSKNFSEKSFSEASVFESQTNNELSKIKNRRILEDVDLLSGANDIIDYYYAEDSGLILYYIDGYEAYKASDLSVDSFDEEKYNKAELVNDNLIESGSFAYKYVNDENWSIAILVANDDVEKITSNDYVEVKFSKTLDTSWAKVSLVNTFDEYSVIELQFTNSMITFCKDRFVEIELLLENDTGLKVPNSSIAEKAFYLIDKAYVTKGSNSSDYVVLRREYGENGEISKAVTIDIAEETDEYYYVETLSLNYGDTLIKPDTALDGSSDSTMIVGKTGTLIGVYNINKGYAEFKRIEILYSNDEYSIVQPNSTYGLRAYDYIALDASIVSEDDFVYY